MIRRFVTSIWFLLLPVHVLSALWIAPLVWSPLPAFWVLLFVLIVVPRLLGMLLGHWVIFGWRRSAHPLPIGRWNYLGNPLPESGAQIWAPYPTDQHVLLPRGVAYYASPTLGGLLLAWPHAVAQHFWPARVATGTTRVFDTDASYLMPVIDDPLPGWQSDVRMVPEGPRLWRRAFFTKANMPYVWMHESHPAAPIEDMIRMRSGRFGVLAGAYCVTVVFSLFAWSGGALIPVLFLEAAVKRLQMHLVRGWRD